MKPCGLIAAAICFSTALQAQEKSIPIFQAVPQPQHQTSFQRDGIELARFHFSPTQNRPFVFPIIGPSGRVLTRIGHPHDPTGHSHHNSCWVSHHDVNGVTFWGDAGTNVGRIITLRVDRLEDGDHSAGVISTSHWQDKAGQTLLEERRRTAVELLPSKEVRLVVDLELTAKGKPVTFGKTPFGIFAVRVAKSMGVTDGGGQIRNSAGNINEQGENGCFWKAAKWVDYSGPVAKDVVEGLTLLDHPANPNHPSVFHVRADGWMGSSLTFHAPYLVEPSKPLRLRYAVYVHAGKPAAELLDKQWTEFSKTDLYNFNTKKP